jgi:hypothetical protein
VLEGVGRLGDQSCLIEELRRLQVPECRAQLLLRQPGKALQQGQCDVLADDSSGLQQALLRRRQAIDAGRQHRGNGVRHSHPQATVALLHDGPRQLLQKEGIPIGFRQNLLRQGLGDLLGVEDCLQHLQAFARC